MAARTRVYHMTIGENDRLVRATNPPHALIETPLGVHRLGGVPYMLTSEPGLTPEQRTGLISGGPNADLRRALGPNVEANRPKTAQGNL